MGLNFEQFANDGNHFINQLEARLGISNRDRTARIFRGVTHVIRDRIPMGEAFNLLAQLPMFAKAVYADQWKYKPEPDKFRTITQYTEALRNRPEIMELSDFTSDDDILDATRHVLALLCEHVSEGEMEKVKHMMPQPLQPIFDEAMADAYTP
ncbi:MAG: DUF2267 domain-containing protein [Cyclobacteriaceae bacterium]